MEIALVEHFPEHGFEVWITDVIMIGAGLGDVFDTHQEALSYAVEHGVPVADLSSVERPFLEGEELRRFLGQFLELGLNGEVISIHKTTQ